MLILSRRQNETIVIDEHIRVTVLEVRGHQIKIGIDAPKSVNIRRSELPKKPAKWERGAVGYVAVRSGNK